MRESRLPQRWWEHTSGIVRFSPKARGQRLRDVLNRLDAVQEWSFGAIEIFAPYHGGTEYNGLDVRDFYTVDPAIGTMSDFLALVEACHERGLAIIAFVNLGYGAMDFPVFLQACDDVRAGRDTSEAHWFLWSDTGQEELDKSLAPHFMNDVAGSWCYSERAGKYYWVKWRGTGNDVDLPQFNFGDPALQAEVKRAVEFWMETGVDGMIIDAVNWYIKCDWEINNATMTDVIRRYPNQYIQPEGAGGFGDDPTLWITEGRYNSVQDYGLAIWWTHHDVFGEAIGTGNPTIIEEALQQYRDRVVDVGGVTYAGPRWLVGGRGKIERSYEQMVLEVACLVSVGELLHVGERMLDLDWPQEHLQALRDLIRTLQRTPALHASGDRSRLSTQDDGKHYALRRTSVDGSSQALAVLNFQGEAADVTVRFDTPVRLEPLLVPDAILGQPDDRLKATVSLPPWGYALYEMADVG